MDAALKAAKDGKEKYPDMIQTDDITDITSGEKKMVSLKDNVYAMLNLRDYSYMSAYSKYYPNVCIKGYSDQPGQKVSYGEQMVWQRWRL